MRRLGAFSASTVRYSYNRSAIKTKQKVQAINIIAVVKPLFLYLLSVIVLSLSLRLLPIGYGNSGYRKTVMEYNCPHRALAQRPVISCFEYVLGKQKYKNSLSITCGISRGFTDMASRRVWPRGQNPRRPPTRSPRVKKVNI